MTCGVLHTIIYMSFGHISLHAEGFLRGFFLQVTLKLKIVLPHTRGQNGDTSNDLVTR